MLREVRPARVRAAAGLFRQLSWRGRGLFGGAPALTLTMRRLVRPPDEPEKASHPYGRGNPRKRSSGRAASAVAAFFILEGGRRTWLARRERGIWRRKRRR